MGKIRTGHFESDGNAYNLMIGFAPSYFMMMNAAAVAGEVFKVEWFGSEMENSKEIQHKVLADNGTTGNLSLDYVSSGGNCATYSSKVIGNRKSVTFDDTGGTSEDLITAAAAAGHGFVNGEKIKLVASGGLPTNLSATTHYYVINATATTFRISTTKGGTAVDFGSDGTAPNYAYSLDNLVIAGGEGVTIATGFVDDGDEVWWLAIEADKNEDLGDVA